MGTIRQTTPSAILLLTLIFVSCEQGQPNTSAPAPQVTVVETVTPGPEIVETATPVVEKEPLFRFARAEVWEVIRPEYVHVYQQGPSDSNVRYWLDWMNSVALQRQKRGLSAERAASIAITSFRESFYSDPDVKYWLRVARQDREDRKLRENSFGVDDLLGMDDCNPIVGNC